MAACASSAPTGQAPGEAPTLVLVSIDGFRWDYATLTETPNLDRLARQGLRAEALKPAFPRRLARSAAQVPFAGHYRVVPMG